MCEIHRLNYVSKGISPTNFLRVFFHPVSEMNEKTESELIDKLKRSGPRCEQNRKCRGTLLYNHLICFWKSAISFLMSFLSLGKTKQDCNWVFLFCMLVQKPFFFSSPLTNIQGSCLGGIWINVPAPFNFLSKLWQQNFTFLFFGCEWFRYFFCECKG